MATSRPIREGDRLTRLVGSRDTLYGGYRRADGLENPELYVLQSDFWLTSLQDSEYREAVNDRVFGIRDCSDLRDPRLAVAFANGTAPGLYVREGDDTSNLETFLAVLRQRRDEAVAARLRREAVTTGQQYGETTATRQDDEIRVGDVVEVVTCGGGMTSRQDVGCRGTVSQFDRSFLSIPCVRLEYIPGYRLPAYSVVSLCDVRKVASLPSPSPSITVATNISPMPIDERITAAVAVETQRFANEYPTREITVNPATGIYIGPATIRLDDRTYTGVITETGTLRRNDTPVSPPPQPAPSPPPPPSRFQLLEVDIDASPSPQQAPKAYVGLAALQAELRAEREAKRALAASQTPLGRFDLLECDLPAVPVVVKQAKVASSTPQSRPVASRPVETITDLTAARSPRELMRMLEGLNDELTTMMRQREAN